MTIDYIKGKIEKKEDIPLIEKAYNFANKKLSGIYYKNNETLINNVLSVTNTLIDFKADTSTLVSSILCETINNGTNIKEIEKEFDTNIANITLGAAKLTKYELIQDNPNGDVYLGQLNTDSPENVRSISIKLAKRLYYMQTMEIFPIEYQKKVARETLDILVPIAQKFKLNFLKSKLEDMCLYYLKPAAYNDIIKKLDATPNMLATYLNNMKENISNLLTENNFEFMIKSRVKNIYSIYNKLASGKSWDNIYDILAIRILVKDEAECYRIAELIHSQYVPLSSRFKDYISIPKENMYQSLHTTIIGEEGRFFEIQIRTYEMNKTAETGKASHQLYKEKTLRKVNL